MSIEATGWLSRSADHRRAAERDAMFRETPADRLRRIALGTAWALKPSRIGGLPTLARVWLNDVLGNTPQLPSPHDAAARPDGLCGLGHDLSVPVLVEAYRRGLYPFAHFGPVKWMSPRQRCVLSFPDFRMSRRHRSRLRQERHRVTFDRAFDQVIKACAEAREGKWHLTWITPKIMHAYAELYDAGHAHSYEVWNAQGDLVGGGYGVTTGGAFSIESQFTRESHASKIGFAMLNWHLAHWGFILNDNKGPTRNCLEAGFHMVPRDEFLALLAAAQKLPGKTGTWQVETDLATVAAWNPSGEQTTQTTPADGPAAAAPLRAARVWIPLVPALDQTTVGLAETVLTHI